MDVHAALGRRHRAIRPSTGAIVVGVLVLGAASVTAVWISSRGDDRSTSQPPAIPFDTTAPPAVAVLPPIPPASAGPVGGATIETVATSSTVTATAPPVRSLQTVPAVRDLIVEIGGRRHSTDGSGAITVAGLDPDAQVLVVGVLADPPIQKVEFVGWADGAGDAPRALRTLAGPVAWLALSLSSRVTVTLADGTTGPATAEFDTEGGAMRVAVGLPTWLVDRRAVRGDAGLTVQQLHYTASSVATSAGSASVAPQTFVATPEARWVVATGG